MPICGLVQSGLIHSRLLGGYGGRLSPPVAGYSFNITVGDDLSGLLYGYGSAAGPFGAFGSIDGEPIPGETLYTLYWLPDGSTVAAIFPGDIESLLTGKDIYVDGVQYASVAIYDSENDRTVIGAGSGPTLTSGTYLAEFK